MVGLFDFYFYGLGENRRSQCIKSGAIIYIVDLDHRERRALAIELVPSPNSATAE